VRYEVWQTRRRIISYLSQVVGAVRRYGAGNGGASGWQTVPAGGSAPVSR
jgi:hypothetical protein